MIQKIKPDIEKAKALVKMSKITLDRLKEIDNLKFPSNALTDYYDSIHKLLDSLSLIEGIKIKGDGAHQELIDYVYKRNNLPEQQRVFLQDMRDFRNRISYEGFSVNENYIKNNISIIEEIIKTLFFILNNFIN